MAEMEYKVVFYPAEDNYSCYKDEKYISGGTFASKSDAEDFIRKDFSKCKNENPVVVSRFLSETGEKLDTVELFQD